MPDPRNAAPLPMSEAPPQIDASLLLDPSAASALGAGEVGDPFALLGPQWTPCGTIVRVFAPPAQAVEAIDAAGEVICALQALQIDGLFAGNLGKAPGYRLRIHWPGGAVQETEDPYSFGLLLGELDLHLIAEGNHHQLGTCLGAQAMTVSGVSGVRFALWAPNARRVAVVGDFNGWDGRRHMMRKRVEAGIWELFIPRLPVGTFYKYELRGPDGLLPLKADPMALQIEVAPRTASVVADPTPLQWTDDVWMRQRADNAGLMHAPMSIYEVHPGSWRRNYDQGARALNWQELGDQLIPYVRELGFTHIELLPVMGHPFTGSWGYQVLSQYAPQASFGTPEQFAAFVDRCHNAGIGVLLDWVPGHFPVDTHGLALFDGTALYEHRDPREGFHPEWNTAVYNFGRREVHSFLISSALHWLEHYHADGLRVDAVASMLYRDYARREGEWIPNQYGGRENIEAVDFLRHLNDVVTHRVPGVLMIAEESTSWPGVTHSTRDGGLGFSYKWNMGWMHDTLRYMQHDPVHRKYSHHDMTFGLLYAFSERFVLPLSHDEVVHGKGSLIGRMPGDTWQRFANLRAYFGFMWSQPGKKLLFMGGEFAQDWEWNHDGQLDWEALRHPLHLGMHRLVTDLNRLYREQPALHGLDSDGGGFHWLMADDTTNSVYAWFRSAPGAPPILMVTNFTPVPRHGYRVGAPLAGRWQEVLNTDAGIYGGSNLGNAGEVQTSIDRWHGQPCSLTLTLPPLATVMLRYGGP